MLRHIITQKSNIEWSDVLEKHGSFIFRVTELGQVDTEVMRCLEVCLLCRMVLGSSANNSYGRWRGGGDGTVTSQWDWSFPELTLLRASSNGYMKIM
jgi:hypothetical protein